MQKNPFPLCLNSVRLSNQLAQRGIEVTTIELAKECVAYATTHNTSHGTILNDDFYTIDLHQTFDLIGYFDGFEIGTDVEQLKVLKRISKWMNKDGQALIDIFNPSYWQHVKGQTVAIGEVMRKYGCFH